jgi:cardiolipin-specific phospholipase
MFFSTAAQVAVRMETMRKAEAGLVTLARRFGEHEPSSYRMELFDTQIPASVLPFRKAAGGWFGSSGDTTTTTNQGKEELTMHAIRVTRGGDNQQQSTQQSQPQYPLVIVHGYMNGALYFYRNLASLTSYFDTVYSVDLLGWGLSSRPSLSQLKDNSVETAEDFFVESLESWRATNEIEKMNLAGHSMGGYLSVAYCEKYPERVDQLLLLSPAGVPEETEADRELRNKRFLNSYPRRLAYNLFSGLWESGFTPGSVMRNITEYRGRAMVEGYVRNRIPAIRDPQEQAVLADYMYLNSILPGSGEYGLSRILNPGAIAKKPCLRRVPELKVRKVSFLYGLHDWMDIKGGLGVQAICQEKHLNHTSAPDVDVYQVRDAGHLLMLENSKSFNASVMIAAGRDPRTIKDPSDLPLVARAPAPEEPIVGKQHRDGSGERPPSVQVTA